MSIARRFVFLCIAITLLASTSTSQKRQGDPQPLSGLDASSIPTYKSIQEYLQANHGSNLLSAARVVGTGQKVPLGTASPAMLLQGGQQSNPLMKIQRSPNGTVRWLEGELNSGQNGLTLRKQARTNAELAVAILKAQSALLRLNNPAEELSLMSSNRDELSYEHVRFQQVYRGVPVWGRDLYVHFNAQGTAYLINGTYEPTPVGVETIPAKSPTAALQLVVNNLKAEGRYQPLSPEASSFLGIAGPTEELVLYPTPQGTFRLGYDVNIHPNLVEWYSFIIDAQDGSILNRIARHCTLLPNHNAQAPVISGELNIQPPHASAVLAGSFADATAKDLNNVNQSLRVWNNGAGTYYMIWDLPNLNAGQSQLPDNPSGGGLTISANNQDLGQNTQLAHNTSPNNTWSDPAAVSAHYNMKVAYDYYTTTHNRKAIDNKDASIMSITHVTQGGKGMDNAYWSDRLMAYGDGDQFFKPLAGALDVSGHEMTHGVIQNSAGLIYQTQSGALNESFADVFGIMIDRTNYLLGENITKAGTGKTAVRDLSNPKNPSVVSPQPAAMSEYQNVGTNDDNGGVHANSGIPNKAAYNVIMAIGRNKAELIYYRALTKYLTRNSQFGDCRKAVAQAATDLVGQSGITSADVASCNAAFEAVGITATTGSGTGSTGNDIPPVSGGKQYIAFMIDNGQIGLYDPSTGQAATFSSASAAARSVSGDRAQLSTGLSGQRIWFINQSRQLAYVDITSGAVSVFQQLKIQQAGDLWNASVSPDEKYVAIASAYANDANLYIYDGNPQYQLSKIPLDPESSQSGVKVQTIQYPDVVSWSPNMNKPKIGFDAFNQVDVGTSTKVSYWSMYEIDFSAGKIYNLVGSQPNNVSIGNVSYSNTDPDLIAFNYVDATGKFDTYVGNFNTGQIQALNIPSFTLNGPIIDAERPSFSPDDAKLCFSSPAQKALLFFEGATSKLTYAPFQVALYNPRWFIQGGKVASSAESVDIPTEFRLHDNYPNPFNPSTKIEYDVPLRSHVRLAVYDILGQLVRTLVNSDLTNGHYSTSWDGTTETGRQVASGTYIYRLEASGSSSATVLSKKMVLLK
ncbi:MAG: M4 family metallopeptidase [Ignavibacteriales bacterium]|nr:M4 family metallopeptidase [Ignavibacteriales bacterium]